MLLDGKSAVITGGGRGIGRAVAAALAGEGAAVIVAARSEQEIEAAAAEINDAGGRAYAVPCDVTDPKSIEDMVGRAVELVGRVDVLINNAGIAPSAPLAKLSLEEWERVFAVNVTATFLCARTFVPGMVDSGWGRLVNVASVAALSGARYIAAYVASKHAVLGFTRCVAAELEGTGVTANVVCPAFVDTPMTWSGVERIAAKTGISEDEALAAMLATVGQRRLISSEEVAAVVVELCAEGAAQRNNEAILMDGKGPPKVLNLRNGAT